ncbi:MAG TPA: hypothetical protein VN607_13145 [Gemmatimonadaceae bacterium]|nr:hypothetical protein [Gemmatimonadaceae bacterium]
MSDTAPTFGAMQLEIQRRLTGEQRLALAIEMSQLARQLLRARLAHEHPNWTGAELNLEVLRSAFLSERRSADLPLPLR